MCANIPVCVPTVDLGLDEAIGFPRKNVNGRFVIESYVYFFFSKSGNKKLYSDLGNNFITRRNDSSEIVEQNEVFPDPDKPATDNEEFISIV